MGGSQSEFQSLIKIIQIGLLGCCIYYLLVENFSEAILHFIGAMYFERFLAFSLKVISNFMLTPQEELEKSDFALFQVINDIALLKRNELSHYSRHTTAK